jgi:DNA-directed RNA polymerase subunit RPC12/RpoP
MRKNRREKCKECNKWFYWEDLGWDTPTEDIQCPHCGLVYEVSVDDSVEVWLVRKITNIV